MAELKISDVFAESANRLPKDAKVKLLKVFMLLTSNPRHPSLQLKKIQGSARNDIYECRVDQFWRIVVQNLGGMLFHLIYVGAHDEAIRHGVLARETAAPYETARDMQERIDAYLAGDDSGLRFRAFNLEETGRLLGIEWEQGRSLDFGS